MSQITDNARECALELAKKFNARVFIYSGEIDRSGFSSLVLSDTGVRVYRPNSILILTTRGGVANSAFQIARYFQITSEKFHLCVPSYCKSAGTLIALGAHSISMSVLSELGPLDVQLRQRDEIGIPRSGMVTGAAFEGLADECFKLFTHVMINIKKHSDNVITFETASKIASDIVCGVMAPVYAQINPDLFGNDLRDLNVARAYGKRLGEYGGNLKSVEEVLDRLISGYPSHNFIIDKDEARELFSQVDQIEELSDELGALTKELGNIAYVEQTPAVIDRLDKESSSQEGGAENDSQSSSDRQGDERGGQESSSQEGGAENDSQSSSDRQGDERGGQESSSQEGGAENDSQSSSDRQGDERGGST